LVKIVVLGEGVTAFVPPNSDHTFTDVPVGNPFFPYIEAAVHANVISGYACGSTPNEPCDEQNRPYFRPYYNVTRGQMAKIVALAEGWPLLNPAQGHFTDTPPGSPFYPYIETAFARGIISGYADKTFRPNASATRGQVSKIVYAALTRP